MTTPLGYIAIEEPRTTKDAYANFRSADRGVSIAKNALQNWFNSFLSPTGANRSFITSSASPVGIQFVTELSYDEEMKEDPNQRKTHLARFFAENTGRLPSILIIDTGVEYVDQGMNDLVGASSLGGRWQGELLIFLRITFSITVATLSEEDTATLASLLMMMVGPLPNAINNYIINEPGSNWELRLPIANLNISQGSNVTIDGDTKTTVWTRSVDFVCDFETAVFLEQEMSDVTPPAVTLIGTTDPHTPPPQILNLEPNQAISLGAPYPLIIKNMRENYRVRISDPNVALVSGDPPYWIQPRSQGRALLLIFDNNGLAPGTGNAPGNSDANPRNPRLVMDLPFRVTL